MSTYPQEQLLQTLTGMRIQINALQILLDNARAGNTLDFSTLDEGLRHLEEMTLESVDLVRASDSEVPLTELDGLPLSEILSRMVEETAERLSLSSRVAISGADEHEQRHGGEAALLEAAERILFFIAREALYQVRQHSGANRLRFVLHYGPDEVLMGIEDDGVLVDAQTVVLSETPAATPGYEAPPPFASTVNTALATLREASIMQNLRVRIEQLGGSLEITQGEWGTRVQARVPRRQTEATTTQPSLTPPPPRATPLPAAPQAVRLLIVDSQAVIRAGLHRLLESYPGIQVVGEAIDGVQAVSEALELGPQLVIMDAQLRGEQSLETLRQIKQLNPDIRVLLLATQDREEALYQAIRAGVDGYALKDIAPDELIQLVREISGASSEQLPRIQDQLANRLLTRASRQNIKPYEALTTRELEVLRLLARGLRNKEIAARLYVSERTVNFHLANIYQKLNVSGRTEALSKALQQGLITT